VWLSQSRWRTAPACCSRTSPPRRSASSTRPESRGTRRAQPPLRHDTARRHPRPGGRARAR
jgi:hypothetical protein